MDPATAFCVGLGGLVALATAFSEERLVRRRVRRARRWPIAELPEATLGRITGRVRLLGAPVRAPLTGRPCAFYLAELFSDVMPGLRRESDGVPFVIEDGSGRAVVDPHLASADLRLQLVAIDGRPQASRAEAQMCARHGIDPSTAAGWTFREAILVDGSPVAILGAGMREPDPDAGTTGDAYRGLSVTRLRLSWSRGYPLALSDAAG